MFDWKGITAGLPRLDPPLKLLLTRSIPALAQLSYLIVIDTCVDLLHSESVL